MKTLAGLGSTGLLGTELEMMMEREKRYFVIKLTDAAKYLTPTQICNLRQMGEQIAELRAADGKPPMHGVFVEHDWPEYEPTWQAIEARMEAVPNA